MDSNGIALRGENFTRVTHFERVKNHTIDTCYLLYSLHKLHGAKVPIQLQSIKVMLLFFATFLCVMISCSFYLLIC